jgi:hypothetical protein
MVLKPFLKYILEERGEIEPIVERAFRRLRRGIE